jgi:hypothetical protein
MKLKFCSCRMCCYGRKKGPNPHMIISLKRAYRHKVKRMLKQGQWEDLPEAIPVPYTD